MFIEVYASIYKSSIFIVRYVSVMNYYCNYTIATVNRQLQKYNASVNNSHSNIISLSLGNLL